MKSEHFETFCQHIITHLEVDLLTTSSSILYDGDKITEGEQMSPTTEPLAVYIIAYLNMRPMSMPIIYS